LEITLLHEFIAENREDIIRRCRAKVATRSVPPPTKAEIEHGVPVFLDQLVSTLRLGDVTNPEIARTALLHGHDLLEQGFTVSQVVHDYGDVCQSVTELAVEAGARISATDFHMLNRCLDDAIAGAVTEYGRGRTQSGIDGEAASGNERLGFLAHELRNLINTAKLAFHVLKTGNVGVSGSTGAVLDRSLTGLSTLITRSLSEVRLADAVQNRESIRLAGFIEEVATSAKLQATAKGIALTILPVEDGVAVEADRSVLAAVIANLLQNAFKFTRPRTTVTLKAGASFDRVLIEIQDECGGLPGGDPGELFRAFEQRGADRSGLGLGLAYSRWAVEANNGRIYARSLPGQGCVFTIDLPRLPVPALAIA
jgi:signal transduction histidine kinase